MMHQPNTSFQLMNSSELFSDRHTGPDVDQTHDMLAALGLSTLDELVEQTVPASIRLSKPLGIGAALSEEAMLRRLREIASKNIVLKSCLGMGYSGTILPSVIQRNVLENPGWYTQYTPYQAEIAQGRLEALLNFQTMISDLTALPLANASLLDEGSAAAEAMLMCRQIVTAPTNRFFVADDCHPQTISVVRTRAAAQGIELVVAPAKNADFSAGFFGILLQYPTTRGSIVEYTTLIARAHESGALAVVAADLLALTLIKAPGEMNADIAVGSTQRFGMPMGFGGPHAAYLACRSEYVRKMPGRLVGVSRDSSGAPALRLAIQTREQHIRRDRATSNICTAQVLPAVVASMYAVYHGPRGLRRIAQRIHALAIALSTGLRRLGHILDDQPIFDTVRVTPNDLPCASILSAAKTAGYNLRDFGDGSIGISFDETTTAGDVQQIIEAFAGGSTFRLNIAELSSQGLDFPAKLQRESQYLAHPVFNTHHSETDMMRYIVRLMSRDLSLTHSMIPLGSCTMKLNAASEMMPISWNEFANMHPFAPADQTKGYAELFTQLQRWLADITGMAAVSLQPNSGSQGEYAGLLAIRGYHESRGDIRRNVCLIPTSAHGTNPASAVVAGMQVVAVACDSVGNVDLTDLRKKVAEHRDDLSAIMITYPSTHGVFEEGVRDICKIVHEAGGLVYMDGANMNAQVALCRPGDIGADVCHLNLHKTFCIPHGGGGPGMGPIAVAPKLAPFLPGDPLLPNSSAVSAAPFGSAMILPIPFAYIGMMGDAGLKRATQTAILNANYMAHRLGQHYPVLFRGIKGRVAHEFIIDCRDIESSSGVKVEDIAKRLMDYGFHAPTVSWPVVGSMMIEPTESENKAELDRFCDALISIREEIREIESGKVDRANNLLKNAPHTAHDVCRDEWNRPYSRERAAFPTAWTRQSKFWPSVGRIDNPFGDRNLVCSCPPIEMYDQGK